MENFHEMEIFQDIMETFQDMEIIMDMVIILDMETKHHTLIHGSTIGRRKQIYHQVYNLHADVLHE